MPEWLLSEALRVDIDIVLLLDDGGEAASRWSGIHLGPGETLDISVVGLGVVRLTGRALG